MNPLCQIHSLHTKVRKRLSSYGKLIVVQTAIETGLRPFARQCGVFSSMVYRRRQHRDTMEYVFSWGQKTLKNNVTKQQGTKYPICEKELSQRLSCLKAIGDRPSPMRTCREG